MTVSGREQARFEAIRRRAEVNAVPGQLVVQDGRYLTHIAACEDVPWLLARVDELTVALNCKHSRTDTDDAGRLWEYVEHEGETWNRCRSCGLLELWAAGNFIKVALLAGRADTEEGGR